MEWNKKILTVNRKWYVLLAGALLLPAFMIGSHTLSTGVQAQASAGKPYGAYSVVEFSFGEPDCWQMEAKEGHIEYTNSCAAETEVFVTEPNEAKDFVVAPGGKLITLGGNIVHFVGVTEER